MTDEIIINGRETNHEELEDMFNRWPITDIAKEFNTSVQTIRVHLRREKIGNFKPLPKVEKHVRAYEQILRDEGEYVLSLYNEGYRLNSIRSFVYATYATLKQILKDMGVENLYGDGWIAKKPMNVQDKIKKHGAKVLEMYSKGYSCSYIKASTGLSEKNQLIILAEEGIENPFPGGRQPARKTAKYYLDKYGDELLEQYKSGISVSELSRRTKISYKTVRKVLAAKGVSDEEFASRIGNRKGVKM